MFTAKVLLFHRWLGILSGGLILLAAGTTLGLNHQDWLRARVEAAQPPQGPFDQYVLSAAEDPRDARHVLLGTHAGLYTTADGGAIWQAVAMPVTAKQVGSLRFDPSRPGHVDALLRDEGLFASEDGGVHWQHETLPVPAAERTQYLALAHPEGAGITVVTSRGLYRRAGGGSTWLHVPKPPAVRHEASRKLIQLIYDLHDGQYWGRWGVAVTDTVSVALIVLVLSGYALFLRIGGRKRRRRPRLTAPLTLPDSDIPTQQVY